MSMCVLYGWSLKRRPMHEMEQDSKAPNVCMIVGTAQLDKKERSTKDDERNAANSEWANINDVGAGWDSWIRMTWRSNLLGRTIWAVAYLRIRSIHSSFYEIFWQSRRLLIKTMEDDLIELAWGSQTPRHQQKTRRHWSHHDRWRSRGKKPVRRSRRRWYLFWLVWLT